MADTEQQGTSSGSRSAKSFIHLEYFKTPLGILKLVEFAVVLLSLILVSSVKATGVGAIDFFIFVATFTWALIVVHILLLLLGLYYRLPDVMISPLVHLVCCAAAVVAFLLCSSILLGKYRWHDTLAAAGAFGLISMGLFIIESVVFFMKYRSGDSPNPASTETTTGKGKDEFADPAQPGY